MKFRNLFSAVALAALLGGCTSGNTAVEPPISSVNPITTNKLQFAVGTSNFNGAVGLNTVVTFRQPNGLDGTLLNTPTITGPAGFLNTGSTGFDANTNTIAGSPQANPVGSTAQASTFGTSGGAFAYGFQPDNSTTGGGVSFARYALPFFGGSTTQQYIGGPPAYPNVRDGTFPSGFTGYPMGFTNFVLKPVTGTYTLSLAVPTGFDSAGNPTSGTVTASSTLATLTPLPAFAAPTIVLDGAGGGTVSANVPAGVTEAMIVVRDGTGLCYPGANGAPAYFTFVTKTTGPQTFTLADTLGPTFGAQTTVRTICSGDSYRVYAVGFNYDAFGAGPPGNRSQAPAIAGANGQADVTLSPVTSGTSP